MARGDQQSLRAALATCEQCGGDLTIVPDPYNACFEAVCRDERCGNRFRHPVRASAFSLPGVVQLVGAVLIGLLFFQLTGGLGWLMQSVAVGFGALLGWAILAFVLRLISLMLLNAPIPLVLKAELVSFLAPAPFLMDGSHEKED